MICHSTPSPGCSHLIVMKVIIQLFPNKFPHSSSYCCICQLHASMADIFRYRIIQLTLNLESVNTFTDKTANDL